jgi:hypothetical protein
MVAKVAQRQVFSKYFGCSFHRCFRTISVCMFFLPEGQAGGTWQTANSFGECLIETGCHYLEKQIISVNIAKCWTVREE